MTQILLRPFASAPPEKFHEYAMRGLLFENLLNDLLVLAMRAEAMGLFAAPQVHRVPRDLFDLIPGEARHHPCLGRCEHDTILSEWWVKTPGANKNGMGGVNVFCNEPPLAQEAKEPKEESA